MHPNDSVLPYQRNTELFTKLPQPVPVLIDKNQSHHGVIQIDYFPIHSRLGQRQAALRHSQHSVIVVPGCVAFLLQDSVDLLNELGI